MQSAWSNRGINLWKVDIVSVLMPQGQRTYPVDASVINVLDTYLRQYQIGAAQNVPCNFSTVAGSNVVTINQPGSAPSAGFYVSINVPVSVGGLVLQGFYLVQSVTSGSTYTITAATNATSTVMAGGAVPSFQTTATQQAVTVTLANHGLLAGQSFTIQVPTAVGGLILQGAYTIASVPTPNTLVIDSPFGAGSTATAAENGGLAAIAVQADVQGFTQNSDPTDLLLYPLSRNDYAAVPDKLQQGRPTSFWYDRTVPGQIYVWPVPDASGPYELRYYVWRQMQDAQPANGQQADLPQRFYEAYCADVAAHLAMKWAPPERALALAAYAKGTFSEAQEEDREKVSSYFVPDASAYFR